MKKALLPLLVLTLLLLSACGNNASKTTGTASPAPEASASAADSSSDTITYQAESGPVEVPAHPQRVIALAGYAGNVLALDVPLVGVDTYVKANPNFQDQLKDVAEVSDENVESILNLKPDLIIASSDTKNVDKLKQIAPVVTYTYNKVDYLTQILEIGKAVNQEQKAADWIADFKARAGTAGEEVKAKIGAESTVTVIEGDSKNLYTFGSGWGRGTEIIYQAMGLKMPDKVKEMTAKDGYLDLSLEVLPDYMGDYVIYSKNPAGDASFQETSTYKNIPAVQNNHVYEVDSTAFIFNDAQSLNYQLDFISKSLKGN